MSGGRERSSGPTVVLGASGFIGRAVARRLAEEGEAPLLVGRSAAALEALRGPWKLRGDVLEVDLSVQGAAAALVERVRPALVLDLAGYGVDRSERDEALAQRLNHGMVAELATALARTVPEARLVHAGTALEFGTVGGDLADPWLCRPDTLYGTTKLAGSRALAAIAVETGLRAVTARLFTVYGAGEHEGRLLPTLLAHARSGEPVPLSAGTQRRDFTYVEDVADGLLRCGRADLAPGTTLNLATGVLTSVRAFAERAAAVLSIPPERLRFGALPARPEEMEHGPVSIRALEAALGWRLCTGIEAGVERALALEAGLL